MRRLFILTVCLLHAGLLLHSAAVNFITVDEVAFLPSGVSHWETGTFLLYRVNPLPQIPSLGSWVRNHQNSEIGPSTVHYYGVFDDHDRLVVLVSMNSDVSDSWEREGDNQQYFDAYAAKGYALGVNVAVWVMTH